MRTAIVLSAILFFAAKSSAQNEDSVVAAVHYDYTYLMDTTQPGNPYKTSQVLFIGKNMSHFASLDDRGQIKIIADENGGLGSPKPSSGNLLADKMNAESAVQKIPPDFAGEANSYYKDSKTATLTFIAFAGGKFYAVKEPMPVINWKIDDETRQIDRFKCQRAVADFKGRSYTAWFCPELPYANGPWKLGGLPGLILEAYDEKKEVVYRFTSIENPGKEKAVIKIPGNLIQTNPKEYQRYEKAIRQRGNGTPVQERKNNNPVEKKL